MKKFFYTLWISLYPILIYTFIQVVLAMVMAVFVIATGVSQRSMTEIFTKNALPITAVSAVLASIFMILFLNLDYNKGRIERQENIKALDFVMAVLGGAGIAVVLNIIVSITNVSGLDNSFTEVSKIFNAGPVFVTILCAGVIIPIAEELIFRGLVFNRIKFQYNFISALLISSIVFGIFHGNLVQGIYATLLGFCLSYTYNKTKSILIPISIHFSANTFVIILGKLTENSESHVILAIIIIVSLIFAAMGIIYFVKRKV